jgi:hypothetical protein
MAAAIPQSSPLSLSRLLRTATSVVVGPFSVDSDSFAERAAGAKNNIWEGLDRIFRKFVDLWTLSVHQGCFILAS